MVQLQVWELVFLLEAQLRQILALIRGRVV